ncbi:unnamed protein product [Victoria cruziana]
MFRHKTSFFFIFILHLLTPSSSSAAAAGVGKLCQPRLCGNFTVKHPFTLERNCSSASASHVLVCHGRNLYLVLPQKGIFYVSAIDYDAQSLGLGNYPFKQGRPGRGVWEMKFREVSSFTVPTHLPNVCEECTKPHGNCGIGLRCICYPKKCKTRIFSGSARKHHVVEAGSAVAFLMIVTTLLPTLLF